MTSIVFENNVFSCKQEEDFAILTLKEDASKIATSLDVKEQFYSTLSTVEDAKIIKGLILLNSIHYPGDIEYFRFHEKLTQSTSRELQKRLIMQLQAVNMQIVDKILNFEKPVVIGMHGNIEPVFFGYSLAADFRYATEKTEIILDPSKMGFSPDGILAFFLMKNIGYAKTKDILLSKKSLNARCLLELELLTKIVSEKELRGKCLEKMQIINELPSHAISTVRRLIQPKLDELEHYSKKAYNDWMRNAMKR